MPIRPKTVLAPLAIALAVTGTHAQSLCGQWVPLVDELADPFSPTVGLRVSSMVYFDAGDGPVLHIAGNFRTIIDPIAGPIPAAGVARFDGVSWSPLPGLSGPSLEPNGRSVTLEVWNDGSGEALYVGGEFTSIAGLQANGIARWDGTTWSTPGRPPLAGLAARIYDIHAHDFGDGERLYVAGEFLDALTGEGAPSVHRFDGASWTPVGDNTPAGGPTYQLASFQGDLFASGRFRFLARERASSIASFDGNSWSVPIGPDQVLNASEFWPLQPHTTMGLQVLAAGGQFQLEEGGELIARSGVIFWDGSRWETRFPNPFGGIRPYAMTPFDNGDGEGLFISDFQSLTRFHDDRVFLVPTARPSIFGLFTHDDGAGNTLYASGRFSTATSRTVYLAQWISQPICPVDLDNNCQLDQFDRLVFELLFSRRDPRADLDRDGSFTLFDHLMFQNLFEAGCP